MSIHVLTSDEMRAESLGAAIARDHGSIEHLRAGWSVMFGPVTRLLFLQSVDPEGAPPAPPSPDDSDGLQARKRQWLREHSPHRPTGEGVTVFELRTYDVRIGQGERFLALMLAALPIRERYSRNFGVWESLSGRLGQVLHLWGYRDLAERDSVRAQLKHDTDWTAYIATILPMLETLDTTILQPLPRC